MKWRRNKSLESRWNKNHLINKYNNTCGICKKQFTNKKQITIDHIHPLSKGGADTLDNMQLAHYSCNLLKNDMTPEEFEEYQRG